MKVSDSDYKIVMSRGGRKVSKPKYKNNKAGGYDSNKEARRAQELKYMQHTSEISDLVEQPRFELIPKQKGERAVSYVADFQYTENGLLVVEDVKSPITRKLPAYIIKRKLMLKIHGIKVRET
jgi:hypothetical protein